MPPHICLSMIVKNEADRIVRALDSCLPHISSYCILDTGSTDETRELIRAWSFKNRINGSIFSGTFENFSQARNDALKHAKRWHGHRDSPWFDYLLLMDADMELRVPNPAVLDNLTMNAYHCIQRSGGTSYDNTRLVTIGAGAEYVGATHEFLNVPGDMGRLPESHIYFIDHADGANRADKYARDIRLLETELETQPNNPRTWFYLANSYRDAGRTHAAIQAFKKRVELGDWDEEQWHAQFDLAKCYSSDGSALMFVENMLKAYNMRPQRAESLHALAKHYRELNEHKTAWLFIFAGLRLKRPDDKLFVADWVYDWAMKEEAAICGFYQEHTKAIGFKCADELALGLATPPVQRQTAFNNLQWYVPKLKEVAPSTEITEINFIPNPGFTAMNPSITNTPTGGLELILRTVNYTISPEGYYMVAGVPCGPDGVIETENWLLQLKDDLSVHSSRFVQWERPDAAFPLVVGLEDMRLFWRDGARLFSATVREQSEQGQCEMWTGLLSSEQTAIHVRNAHRISDPNKTEKNWMPIAGEPKWMYNCRQVTSETGWDQRANDCKLDLSNLRGSSQLMKWGGQLIAVTHEATYRDGKRAYIHRFVTFDNETKRVLKVSMPFVFEECQIEFAAGIAYHPTKNYVIVSFGSKDSSAKLAVLSIHDIHNLLENGLEG